MALLDVHDLRTSIRTERGPVHAVDGVDLSLQAGRTLGLVGESGCGKTMLALSILRLTPPESRVTGRIAFEGRDLLALPESEMRTLRGDALAMIFQEPMTSLNPVFTVGTQIAEAARVHLGLGRRAAKARAVEMLRLVEIPEPQRRAREYPHQLSGGMRQRVMIAMSLACHPRLLIADEPTTALDVTIQAQILDLLAVLQHRLGMAMILVTHDLGVVAERADEVAIMYAGRVVEQAPVSSIFANPRHPYTVGLLRSIPRVGAERTARLEAIAGVVPDLADLPSGCHFRDRCPIAIDACATTDPPLRHYAAEHQVACLRAGDWNPQ
jgi:oligopeptide/dipeptide ABC transporter ATP-binding protein